MTIAYEDKELNPQAWEELIDSIYRIRYKDEGYQYIPARDGGDYGIEGYTETGKVYQCYFPEGEYSSKDLYDKLRDIFIDKLKKYNYASNKNIHSIEISKDRLIPTLNGFDLMKDGSASDLIRIIWDFTLSLLTVSNKDNGNHIGIVIFDEPAQQSIENGDLYSFIEDMNNEYKDSQVILGITLNNADLENYIRDMLGINLILIEDKAIRPIV